jgi:hypothetical protein
MNLYFILFLVFISCGKKEKDPFVVSSVSPYCISKENAIAQCIELNKYETNDVVILCNTVYVDPEKCYKYVYRFSFRR